MGSKKTTTNTTQNQATHLTTTPTNPDWVTSGVHGVSDILAKLGTQDPTSFIAGPDPLQTQAGAGAAGLTTSPLYTDASALFKGVGGDSYNPATATSASLLDNLPAYMSPYTNDVVKATLAGYDDNAGRVRGQQMLDLAGDTTFGGSGGSILRSLTEGQLGLGRAQTEAQLRDQAFNTGANLSGQDADRRQAVSLANANTINAEHDAEQERRLAAGQGLATTGAQQGADQRANIDTQSQIGSILQALEQQKAGAPLAFASGLADMWKTLPLGLFNGQNADGTMSGTSTGTSKESGTSLGDWLNFFAANAAAAAKG